jgi:hypothetical protein
MVISDAMKIRSAIIKVFHAYRQDGLSRDANAPKMIALFRKIETRLYY